MRQNSEHNAESNSHSETEVPVKRRTLLARVGGTNPDTISSSSCFEAANRAAEICYETDWGELSESEKEELASEYENVKEQFDQCVEEGYINQGSLKEWYEQTTGQMEGETPATTTQESEVVTATPTPSPTETPTPSETPPEGSESSSAGVDAETTEGSTPEWVELSREIDWEKPWRLTAYGCTDEQVEMLTSGLDIAYDWLRRAEQFIHPEYSSQAKAEVLGVSEKSVEEALNKTEGYFPTDAESDFQTVRDNLEKMKQYMQSEDGVIVDCVSNYHPQYVLGEDPRAWVNPGGWQIHIPSNTFATSKPARRKYTESMATVLLHEISHAAADTGDKTEGWDKYGYDHPKNDAYDIHSWFQYLVYIQDVIDKDRS